MHTRTRPYENDKRKRRNEIGATEMYFHPCKYISSMKSNKFIGFWILAFAFVFFIRYVQYYCYLDFQDRQSAPSFSFS
jgi:hypothetical protein